MTLRLASLTLILSLALGSEPASPRDGSLQGHDLDEQIERQTHFIDDFDEGEPTVTLKSATTETAGPRSSKRAPASIPPLVEGASTRDQVPLEPQTFKLYDIPAPDYPQRCLRAHIEGTVLVKIRFGKKGRIEELKVVRAASRCPEFTVKSMEAIRQAKFHPPPKGRAVLERTVLMPFNFELDR